MRGTKLVVRPVRRYRVARYPSRHREAKRAGSLGRRALRAAAVPAVALGIGAVGGACDGGMTLAGTEPDAGDATETTVEVGHDTPPVEVGEDDAGVEDVAVEDAEPEWVEPDGGINGDMPAGTHYLRYFTEAEGRAILLDAIRAADGEPTPPCMPYTLGDRLREDQPFVREGDEPVNASIDLLAEPFIPPCVRGELPAVGFEWMTEEARDDEDTTGNPAGLTDAEELALRNLRAGASAAISVLPATDYAYGVWDYEGWIDDSDRARAETLLRETAREIVEDLRRNGLI